MLVFKSAPDTEGWRKPTESIELEIIHNELNPDTSMNL